MRGYRGNLQVGGYNHEGVTNRWGYIHEGACGSSIGGGYNHEGVQGVIYRWGVQS